MTQRGHSCRRHGSRNRVGATVICCLAKSYLEMSFAARSTYDQTKVCGRSFVTCHPRTRSTSPEVSPTGQKKEDVSSTPPFPTNPLLVRSLLPASLPLESFEAPLSCLRPHPKHQGLRRSGRPGQSPTPPRARRGGP